MKKAVFLSLFFFVCIGGIHSTSNSDQQQSLRAFPITGYFVDLNDSTRLVQVELPDGVSFSEKQMGILRGVYRENHGDTVLKGYGRCQLIKGNFYYFAITGNNSGIPAREGDLLYTFMDPGEAFTGYLSSPASHYITLQDVFGNAFYDPFTVFSNWNAGNESFVLDSMVKDIRFTGRHFKENDASMDMVIKSGSYKGEWLLDVMMECSKDDLVDFLRYMKARPLLYAGRTWKIAELFATWVSEGAPKVVMNGLP